MNKLAQYDMFDQTPEWLLYLRTRAEYVEIPWDIQPTFWYQAGLFVKDVAVCVGHWYDEQDHGTGRFKILLMFEEGDIYALYPMQVFPAQKPEWFQSRETLRV